MYHTSRICTAKSVADLHTKVSGTHPPPKQDQILSFLHMYSPKSVSEVGTPSNEGWCPPQHEILDPPLQIDGYVQKIPNWGVHIYQFYKHPDTNLRFCLILRQLKLLTSGNSYIQLPYAHVHCCTSFHYHYWVLVHPKSCRQLYSFH